MRSAVALRSRRAYPPYGLAHQTGRWLKVVGWISAAHPPESGNAQGMVRTVMGVPANPLPLPAWIANDARDLGPGGVVRWIRSAVPLRSRRAYPPYCLAHQTGRWLKVVGWISAAHPPESGNAQGMVRTVRGRWRTHHHRRHGLRMMPGISVLAAWFGGCAPPSRCAHGGLIHIWTPPKLPVLNDDKTVRLLPYIRLLMGAMACSPEP